MQLVAVKRISAQRPLGSLFDEEGARARILIALGLAKPYIPPPPRRSSVTRRQTRDDPEPAA